MRMRRESRWITKCSVHEYIVFDNVSSVEWITGDFRTIVEGISNQVPEIR